MDERDNAIRQTGGGIDVYIDPMVSTCCSYGSFHQPAPAPVEVKTVINEISMEELKKKD